MLNVMLFLILAGCVVAWVNWRWGVAAAIVVGLAQDPLRKLIPGTPAYLAMASVPVWVAALVSAIRVHPLFVNGFFTQFPRLARWMKLFGFYLVIPAAISATWGAGTWKITVLGIIVYSATFLAMVAGWRFVRRPEDIGRLLGFYALVTGLFLIGGPLDSLGWSERFPAIGTAAMGHIWVTYRTGAPVYMLAGLFRGPDVMGWHASLVFMVAVVMALRSKGVTRWLWIVLAAWGVLNIWLCGRRKMLAMLPVFAGCYVFLIFQFKSLRRLVAVLGIVAVVGGLGWYVISSLFQDDAVERFYLTTITEAEDRAYRHGYQSIFSTVRQAGFWGYGLGMSQQGVHNIQAEKPRLYQESGPPKLFAELGIPGAFLFLAMGSMLLATAYQVIRYTRRDPAFYYMAGILSIIVANAISGIVSAQIYGDPLVVLLLAFLMGLLFSGARIGVPPVAAAGRLLDEPIVNPSGSAP